MVASNALAYTQCGVLTLSLVRLYNSYWRYFNVM